MGFGDSIVSELTHLKGAAFLGFKGVWKRKLLGMRGVREEDKAVVAMKVEEDRDEQPPTICNRKLFVR